MVLQSSFFDPVVGLDTHIVMIPSPAGPVPTPVPMPFVGMVFDPVGLAVGAAIGCALGGGPGIVLVNSMPATNCGTEVTNKLTMPHLPAPGVAFATGLPGNDAELYFGSLNVSLGGSYGVRLGDIALSCGDPVRLPTSVVMAIPKGMPVLNMPAMVPDLAAIAMALAMRAAFRVLAGLLRGGARLFRALRQAQRRSRFWRRAADRVHRAVDGHFPPSLRARMHRAACFLTGHPVDVATGRVLTDATDFEIAGPLPLRFVRSYDSSLSWREGPLGRGWHHSFDQAVWRSRDKVYFRAEDGRQLEFSLREFPNGECHAGSRIFDPITRLELRALPNGAWEIHARDQGTVRGFAPLPGEPNVARIIALRTANHHFSFRFEYDSAGRLAQVTDGNRSIRFEHHRSGRLASIALPSASGSKGEKHRTYDYDDHGQLTGVTDAMGHSTRYDYRGALLVQETDRNGHSFYFQYDGIGWAARCVRTWGDGGVQDRELAYDVNNRKTFVTDTRGSTTVYSMDDVGQVVEIMTPDGGITLFEYDGNCGRVTLEKGPLGATRTSRYDVRGNRVEYCAADGATQRMAYDAQDRLVEHIDALGGRRAWGRNADGDPVTEVLPNGLVRTLSWSRGLLAEFREGTANPTQVQYDREGFPAAVQFPNGSAIRYRVDAMGRTVHAVGDNGERRATVYDAEGRPARVDGPGPQWRQIARDNEGRVIEIANATRRLRLERNTLGRITRRDDGGSVMNFEYDGEGALVAAVNAAAERHEYEYDAAGRIAVERGFDGVQKVYQRDVAGRVIERRTPCVRTRFSYDDADRLVASEHDDGSFAKYEYRADGFVVAAHNESVAVAFDRDPFGRIVREVSDDAQVATRFDAVGRRIGLSSSLGSEVQIARDEMGAVTSISIGAEMERRPPVVQFVRDPDGRERRRHYANGVVIASEYDPARRPSRRQTFARLSVAAALAAGLAAPSESAAAELTDDIVYTWRGEDQIASIARHEQTREFQHDAAGRLIGERSGEHGIARPLDALGNAYRNASGTDRAYGAGGRLLRDQSVQFEFDEDGRQTAAVSTTGRTTFTWNGHGLLTRRLGEDGSHHTFVYDAFARRVRQAHVDAQGTTKADTRYTWDRDRLIHERRGDALTTWHWDPDMLAPFLRERGGRQWAIAVDHLGTPTEMYDGDGHLAWQMVLDVNDTPHFGAGVASDCPFRRPGQYHDDDLGLCNQRWRYFDLRGRFLSSDPSGLAGGFNPAAYTADPMVRIDPLGLADGFIFRGVHADHPALEDARAGTATPAAAGSAVSATDHNIGGVSGSSPYTSWTHDPEVALRFAEGSGPGGVVLVVPVGAPPEGATWRWEFSDDAWCESEVLLDGRREGCEAMSPAEFRRRFAAGGCG